MVPPIQLQPLFQKCDHLEFVANGAIPFSYRCSRNGQLMGLVRHGIQISMEAIFGLPPSEIHRMTGLPPKIV